MACTQCMQSERCACGRSGGDVHLPLPERALQLEIHSLVPAQGKTHGMFVFINVMNTLKEIIGTHCNLYQMRA